MFAATIVVSVCHWLTVVVPARFGLTELVGEVALAYAVGMPLFSLTGMHLRTLLATDAGDEFHFREYLTFRLFGTCLGICLLLLVCHRGSGSEASAAMLTIGLAIAVDSISDILFGYQQKYERLDRVAVSLLVRGPLGFAGYCLALQMTGLAWAGGLGLLVGRSVALLAIDIPFAISSYHSWNHASRKKSASSPANHFKIRWRRMLGLAWRALPMGITILLVDLQLNLPRMQIASLKGLSALGLFAGLTSFLSLGSLIIVPLSQIFSPRLAAHSIAGRKTEYLHFMASLLGIATLIGMGGLAISLYCSELLLVSLFGEAYRGIHNELPWVMLVLLFRNIASALGCCLTASRILAAQPVVHCLAIAIVFVCGEIWIPAFGVHGAVCAVLAGSGFLAFAFAVLAVYAVQALNRRQRYGISGLSLGSEVVVGISPENLSSVRNSYGEVVVNPCFCQAEFQSSTDRRVA